ncbi:MAG: phenylalanine--tRNA ligase subunit beta [Verrucomicrobiota bacterium]|nr:phenylalanine--tRNA ligase subunit beta [Verrucomicrobiota bacterium]
MKVTYNWLKEYVDFDSSPDELIELLTMAGLEVESIEKVSGGFDGIVVAEVLEKEQHPDADRLSLCKVNDGQEVRQIVCGATNFDVGSKVPLALPGCEMPSEPDEKPFKIKVGKIRGVESCGMMCSAKELGIAEDASGLLLLPEDARVGQSFAEHLGRTGDDVVYDLEVTPNRPDWNSVIGIARELSALTDNPLCLPKIPKLPTNDEEASDLFDVLLDNVEQCPRYNARIVRGVKVGPSPDWLRNKLEMVGVRSINNVVDVTNFVMLETGQPLHAFDFQLLSKKEDAEKPVILVRNAAKEEKFITLDEKEHELANSDLLIADETKGVALAGIMGGLNSEIGVETKDVFIECAYFDPKNIRATAKKLAISTDASYRFERGCDPNCCDLVSRRAAQLIIDTAGGVLVKGNVDAYPFPVQPKEIQLRFAKADQLLGISIPADQQVANLTGLGLEEISRDGDTSALFRIPTSRVDLKREVDLIEEVVRIFGVDKVPSTPPRGCVGTHSFDTIHDAFEEIRSILIGLGLYEAQTQTLVSGKALAQLGINQVALEYPLSSEQDKLRTSLLPGLTNVLKHNANHEVADVAMFEIGRVFRDEDGMPAEGWRLGVALTGRRFIPFHEGENRDAINEFTDLKGILEEFAEKFGMRGVGYERNDLSGDFLIESGSVSLGNIIVGTCGQLSPLIARHHDLKHPVFLAEFDLDLLLQRRTVKRSFKMLPAFPGTRRDIAMIVAEDVTHDAVLASTRKAKPKNLKEVELFDVYRGAGVEEGDKSVAYAFHYRSNEGTLKDNQVDAIHEKVIEQLRNDLNATIRG